MQLNSATDLYHVSCFEEIADFSEVPFVRRVSPVMRSTFTFRGIKAFSILNGKYLVDGGAERLVLHWMLERSRQIEERNGVVVNYSPFFQNFTNLLYNAGTPGFNGEKPMFMTEHEYSYLLDTLAPNESDGPDDREV
jgi:hypothetical protein